MTAVMKSYELDRTGKIVFMEHFAITA